MNKKLNFLFVTLLLFTSCGGSGGSDDSETPVIDSPAPVVPAGRVWTLAEIIAEPRSGGSGGEARCGGEFGFRRCICPSQVPSAIRYRPAVAECNGNAAVITYDNYEDIFSVVVRDTQNRDRWPVSGFNGCSLELSSSEDPPKACSAFKVQDAFPLMEGGGARVHCLGASGYSELFSDVVRMTVKLSDDPFSNDDDIERFCLISGDEPLN